jgi:hypothetical protein
MFCSKCGIDTDSQFCKKCGRRIGTVSMSTTSGTATAVAPARYRVPESKPKESESDLAVWVLLPILLVGVGFTVTAIRHLQPLSTQSRVEQIANTPVTVRADRYYYYYYEFVVPLNAKNAIVNGHFSTAGRTGDEIEAYILNKDDFENWWNGKQSQTFYQSGRVTRSKINARLPAGDVYYLLLNNQVSQASSKVVDIDAIITYNP